MTHTLQERGSRDGERIDEMRGKKKQKDGERSEGWGYMHGEVSPAGSGACRRDD